MSSKFGSGKGNLDATLARLIADLGEAPVPVRTAPSRPWIGLTTSYAVYVAHDAPSQARVHAEGKRLLWAAGFELPVPEVVSRGPGWLVTSRAPHDEPLPDGSYASAVVDAVRRISAATVPARQGARDRPRGWDRVRNLHLSLLREPAVPWHEYRALRRAVAGLSQDRLAHGDFSRDNVLFDRAKRSVILIDWELLGYRPAHYDLCKLWPRLRLELDREIVLEAALEGAADRAALGLLHYWLALRYLAGLLGVPRARRDAEEIEVMQERVAEARANAKRWR